MKVIIYQGSNHFKNRKCEGTTEDSNIVKYIKQHKFFSQLLSVDQILKQIKQKVCKNASQNNQIKNKMQQLSLYLNNQKNKSMFQIYEIVLRNPKGVTYKTIDNKLKIGIVSVSHYCCRLKKMNFVDLRHQKNQKVVFSKDVNYKKTNQQQDQPIKKTQSQPFHFNELSMVDNIWINVSSYQSYKKNGITNEDIKQKLSKTSQTKLIMKLVDQVKETYQFDKQIVSQGKVFENRFRNITKEIIKISKGETINQQNEVQQKLNPRVQEWLKEKFPQYDERKFLFNLVNTQLKDYFTVDGLKSAKRDCTPIKLIRYIKILNSLNNRYPQTHIQLKNFIIDQQKQSSNGTMHKRSILGILDGLVSKGILKKNSMYYYPLWQPDGIEVSIQNNQEQDYDEATISKPKKKVKLSSLTTKQQIGNKVNLNQYKKQLKIKLFCAILQQYQRSNIKKSFKKIKRTKIYPQKKNRYQVRIYEPEVHIFNFLQGQNYRKLPKLNVNNYEDLTEKIDQFVQSEGVKEQKINVNYQILKTLRKAGKIKENQLKNRFGSGWQDKISVLLQNQIIKKQQDGVWTLQDKQRYFL